ncbi:MAG: aldo/keto reductase [Clostridia bacterium]|nr:aldo/keto reductase [Clostridia bacterium]
MEKRVLHGTDLNVSKLCMGTVNFGTTLTQEQSFAHLDRFMEHGGNFLDTAHVYSNWIPGETSRSEKIIGRWLKRQRRSDVILCTKGGHFDFTKPEISRVTPEQIRMDLCESLEYLQTDYIDLYMLHRDNPALPVGEIMDCLDEFVKDGRVRYLACSNWSAARTAEANVYARRTGKHVFVVNELMWSMAVINKDAIPSDYVVIDEEMLRIGRETGLNFMCFTALAKGYFTRRFAGKPLSEELHRTYDHPRNEQQFDLLRGLANCEAVTNRCLRYFDEQDVTAIPIVSCSSMEQLMECIRAFA